MHMAAVDPGGTGTPVRAFGTFTQDLHEVADWFKACGVIGVAMESTGVYWIPVYEILEQRGSTSFWSTHVTPRACLDAKTDVSDVAWLRQLHSCGFAARQLPA